MYVAEAEGEPEAGDDAGAAAVFTLDALPSPLAFDHDRILSDYRRFRETGRAPPPED